MPADVSGASATWQSVGVAAGDGDGELLDGVVGGAGEFLDEVAEGVGVGPSEEEAGGCRCRRGTWISSLPP